MKRVYKHKGKETNGMSNFLSPLVTFYCQELPRATFFTYIYMNKVRKLFKLNKTAFFYCYDDFYPVTSPKYIKKPQT